MSEQTFPSTVAELRKVGYKVKVSHKRAFKIAYLDWNSKKLIVKRVYAYSGASYEETPFDNPNTLFELLPRGGRTELSIRDPETGIDFESLATCRDDENYNKKTGVARCIFLAIELMKVCEFKNDVGFKIKTL
jgi:hypothetical protein